MGQPLKEQFGPEVPARIAAMLRDVQPAFPVQEFIADALDGYEALELTPRARQIAHALHRHLPDDYGQAVEVLVASLGPTLEEQEPTGMASFRYLPHVLFVAEFGAEHFEESMRAQYELTQRFTAEFSIRVFLEREPERTLSCLRDWASDPSAHVRRLVSEGTRPRLPWAPRLRAFQADPGPVLELLELLRNDEELYVRRSVANNLNDIGKDNPDALSGTCRRWAAQTPERRWMVRHALRSLIKQGDPRALAILGYTSPKRVALRHARFSPAVAAIGGSVRVEAELANDGRESQPLLVDLRIHFVKASGNASPKVFKLKEVELESGDATVLAKTISLAQQTTRTHYPGEHRAELLVNGDVVPAGSFEVAET